MLISDRCRYNIQYGRPGAAEADIIAAAKSADIHERILTFPDLYETQVRGGVNYSLRANFSNTDSLNRVCRSANVD